MSNDSYKTNLEFAIDTTGTQDYSKLQPLTPVSYESFIKSLHDGIYTNANLNNPQQVKDLKLNLNSGNNSFWKSNHHITTKIGNEWLMALDCDGEMDKDKAVHDLISNSIDHCIVISSYNNRTVSSIGSNFKYWILCDFIKPFDIVIDMASKISGVDKRYIDCCKKKKVMNLRGYPKNFSVPVFGNCDKGSDSFKKWVNSLNDYWYGSDMKFVYRKIAKITSMSDLELVGDYFSKSDYEKIQMLINEEYEDKIVIQDRRELISKSMNAVYGLEI